MTTVTKAGVSFYVPYIAMVLFGLSVLIMAAISDL